MKYHFTVISFLIFLASSFLFGRIITVDNRPGATYQSLANAVNALEDGDTLLVTGSEIDYGNITITGDSVTVIGPGYFLAENSGFQANTFPATVGQVTFTSTAEQSVVQGLYITRGVSMAGFKCILERNYVSGSTSGGGGLRVENNQDSCIIRQNFVNTTSSVITLSGGTNNVFIYNNYFKASAVSLLGVAGEVYNNVFDCSVTVTNLMYNSNIQISGNFTPTNIVWYNNIGSGIQYGTINGNQSNVDMSTVFASDSMSTDDQYRLNPDGPAVGAGFGGVDCGMYDDSFGYKYIPSGIPAIPSIYEFSADEALENVTIRVRSNL